MKHKKAISAVVATVLIILITVAAVTIIWSAIIPMIQDQLSGGTVCLDASAAVTISKAYTCIDTGSAEIPGVPVIPAVPGEIRVQVSRGVGGSNDFELAGLRILVSVGGDTYDYEVAKANVPSENGEKVYTLTGDDYNATATEVSVAAIVTAGNKEKECEAGLPVTLSECP